VLLGVSIGFGLSISLFIAWMFAHIIAKAVPAMRAKQVKYTIGSRMFIEKKDPEGSW
jgi:hypothetical protein